MVPVGHEARRVGPGGVRRTAARAEPEGLCRSVGGRTAIRLSLTDPVGGFPSDPSCEVRRRDCRLLADRGLIPAGFP